ncbi:MAG: hypothetical protein DKINENOH_03500 [bacterium]|nr:hypothetical protein [bacterium]
MMPWKEILELVLSIMKSKRAKRLFKKLTLKKAEKLFRLIILMLIIIILSFVALIAGKVAFRIVLSEIEKKKVQTQQIENLNEETAQLDRQQQDASMALDALQLQGETLLSSLDILRDEHAKELHSLDSSASEMVPAKQNRAPEVTIESFSPEPLAAYSAFDRPLQQRHTDLVDIITANSDSAGDEHHVGLIRQELAKHNATLADLYARHVKMTPGLKGHVKIRFRIDGRGFLMMPHVIENGLEPNAAAARFIEEMQYKMIYWRDFPVTAEQEETFYLATYQFGSEQ